MYKNMAKSEVRGGFIVQIRLHFCVRLWF